MYIVGPFTIYNGRSARAVKVRESNGSMDTTWNPYTSSIVNCIVKNGPDIYLGGWFITSSGITRNRGVKVNDTYGEVDNGRWCKVLDMYVMKNGEVQHV